MKEEEEENIIRKQMGGEQGEQKGKRIFGNRYKVLEFGWNIEEHTGEAHRQILGRISGDLPVHGTNPSGRFEGEKRRYRPVPKDAIARLPEEEPTESADPSKTS